MKRYTVQYLLIKLFTLFIKYFILVFEFYILNDWLMTDMHYFRDAVEKNLQFLGFLIMQNTLKPQTQGVIRYT